MANTLGGFGQLAQGFAQYQSEQMRQQENLMNLAYAQNQYDRMRALSLDAAQQKPQDNPVLLLLPK